MRRGVRVGTSSGLLLAMCLWGTGCRTASHADNGALIGSGLGALTGAIIGHNTGSGHAGAGAVLGAIAGGVGGALVGDAQDAREERDAAIAHAKYTQYAQQAQAAQRSALTNSDVIVMSRNGLSNELIISTIRNRGGRFDTSPNAIIDLNASGVSDQVIQAMQTAPRVPDPHVAAVASAPDVVVVPAPQTVYVRPHYDYVVPARTSFYFGTGPHHHRHCH